MKQQDLPVTCTYSENGDAAQILHRSFSLYLDRVLAETEQKPYHRRDEWPLMSGGNLCT